MKIWIVNPFDPIPGESFRPGRYAFIAKMLSEKNHKVTWWTSNFFHVTKQYRCSGADSLKINTNLTVKMISTPSYRNNVSFARLYNHYIYGKRFEYEAIRVNSSNKPDVILASLPPIDSAAAAIRVSKKLGSKVIIDIQDLWPEIYLFPFPDYTKPVIRLMLNRLFKKTDSIYNNADALIAVSNTYLNRGLQVCKNPKPGLVLHLGIDLKFFDSEIMTKNFSPTKKNKEIWITYIGTLGKTYDLDTILKAAHHFSLYRGNKIMFIIAGDGPDFNRLKNKSIKQGLKNIIFTGLLGFSELVYLLKQSDIGLNAFSENALQTFPNKVFDYFAARIPIINSIPGELQKVLDENQAGLYYKAGDMSSLVEAIEFILNNEQRRKEMSINARRLAEQNYDRNKIYPKVIPFLEELISRS